MGSVLCDSLWYRFTIDLYKYVSNSRQGQHSKQLGLCYWSSERKGNLVPLLGVVDSF
jgi:hypothetical protein